MVTVDVASKTKKEILRNPESEFYDVSYSPDSQWLTYTKPAANQMSVVYVYNLKTGKEYPVTENGITLRNLYSVQTESI